MDGKYSTVEANRENDETEKPSKEMLKPQTLNNMISFRHEETVDGTYRSDGVGVTKEHPQLKHRKGTDPGDGEKADPFDAESTPQAQACECQPEPPEGAKGIGGPQFMLICKGGESQGRESRKKYQWRVEENQTRLGDQPVFWNCQQMHSDFQKANIPKTTAAAPINADVV